MKSVLIPVDGSRTSAAAVGAVLREGAGTIGRVELINVQPRLNRHIARFVPRTVRDDWREERARAAMEPALRRIRAAGIACRTHLALGRPAPEIALAARSLGVDEIILGARRRGAVGQALFASTPAALLALSEVPVRIVPGPRAPAFERLALPAGLGLVALMLMAEE